MAEDKAAKKREASRRCTVKKKAADAGTTVEAYVKKEFGTTLETYVTDAFHNKKGKTEDTKTEIIRPDAKKDEENFIPSNGTQMRYQGPDMTVEEFLRAYLATDKKDMERSIKNMGANAKERAKILAEKMIADNHDMYFAAEWNVGREVIEHFVVKGHRAKRFEEGE